MELRDKNGLTEKEFLASYDSDKYPKPSLTADVAMFARTAGGGLKLLLIRRGGHPCLGCLALPGGFAEKNEPLEATAARELQEETGVTGAALTLVGVYSKPGRDKRGWVVTAAYAAVVNEGEVAPRAADDAADAQWYDVEWDGASRVLTLRRDALAVRVSNGTELFTGAPALAFDHAQIITDAVRCALNLKPRG